MDFKARIKELEQQLAERDALIAKLEARIAALEKNSRNSSKPPSSDIIAGKPKASDQPKRAPKKRKPGKQKGHKACVRQPFPPEQVDRTWTYDPPLDPDLWERLPDDQDRIFQQVELRPRPFEVTEHRLPRFRHRVTGDIYNTPRPSELKGQGLFGPRMIALTALLKSTLHGSYRGIQSLYADALGLKVSTGYLAKAVGRMSDALEQPYETLRRAVSAQAVVNVDETGHKDRGSKCWTWTATCPAATVFRVADSRSADELYELLGEDFDGVVCSDFFSAYTKFNRQTEASAQFCWAHLIRELRFREGLKDKPTARWAGKVLEPVRRLFRAWRRGQMAACQRARSQIIACCRRPPQRGEVVTLAGRIREREADYFRFLDQPGVEPTNNAAERALRPLVLHRKVTQGTRGERGMRWCERMWSVAATCRQHGESVFDYCVSALEAAARGNDPPGVVTR